MGPLSNFGFVGRYQESYCTIMPTSYFKLCIAAGEQFYGNYAVGAEFLVWAVCFASITSAANCFGLETANYLREYRRGMSTTPYFLGKFLSELPRMLISCCFFYANCIMHFANVDTMKVVFSTVLVIYWWSWPIGFILEGVVGWKVRSAERASRENENENEARSEYYCHVISLLAGRSACCYRFYS